MNILTIIPESDKKFLLELNKRFGIESIEINESPDIFSQDIIDKILMNENEMEGYYEHLHLMELTSELLDEAKKNGFFKIIFSNGEIITERN